MRIENEKNYALRGNPMAIKIIDQIYLQARFLSKIIFKKIVLVGWVEERNPTINSDYDAH